MIAIKKRATRIGITTLYILAIFSLVIVSSEFVSAPINTFNTTPTDTSPAGNTVDSSSKNFPSTISITDTMKPLSLEIGFDEVDD